MQEKMRQWLDSPYLDKEVRKELLDIQNDDDGQRDRFCKNLEFGTGGLRGVLGAGTNRMNVHTIDKATRGLAAYFTSAFVHPSCVIAYDSRNKSELFARLTAAVLARHNITTYLFAQLTPTPMLSFAVRNLRCSGGVVITASHNPAAYNGYKVYGADGCQLTPEAADAVQREIEAQADIAPLPDFEALLAQGAIRWVDDATVDAYFASVQAVGFGVPEAPLSVVYSPLNGAGNQPVRRMLREIGNVAVRIVPQQELPDGNFPTCPYPNPEAASAMTLAAQLARQTNADFFFATDPDCDRVGAGLWDGEALRLFSGNEMAVLLFDYICTRRAELGTMPACPVAVTTVVSTPMLDALAKKHGVALRKVLTGFKYIGEQVGLLEQAGQAERFLFGCEESCGYLTGLSVRDKDAVNAVMLLCQMAAYHKARGKNLAQALMGLYETYGFYQTALLHFAFEGACGMDRMGRILDYMRRTCTAHFAGYPVQSRVDYEADKTGLPQCNMLFFALEQGGCVFIRPSGTEPKLKLYLTEVAQSAPLAAERLAALQSACNALIEALAAEK